MPDDAVYYGPLRRLGMTEYPKFEDFVQIYGFLAYQVRPDDVFFRGTLEALRIVGGLSCPPILRLLKGTVLDRQGLKVGKQYLSLLQMLRWRGLKLVRCRSRKYAVRVGL